VWIKACNAEYESAGRNLDPGRRGRGHGRPYENTEDAKGSIVPRIGSANCETCDGVEKGKRGACGDRENAW